MNKMKSSRKTVPILAIAAIVLLVVGIYAMTRPISYGADYYHASFYEGDDFHGTMTFYDDNTVVVCNTNLDEEMKFFYYYKNGYVFLILAETEEGYKEEVAAIDGDFEGAVNTPFYASKINAFRNASEGLDDYKTVYLCQSAIMMAVVWGAIELVLIGFAIRSVSRGKKSIAHDKTRKK